MSRIAVALLCLSLTACGLKGPLVLPPGPAPEPWLGNAKPTPKPAKRPDVSTDTPTPSAQPE
ncbi:lipoprotein [Dechloromonas sp. ZS-1]|uniref:LPS translocon maturation chaperone LptM n=1 Tax=Dechloromonas sp. ZS-1 TaxID=3138067 RepID=UPI0031FD98A5